MLAGAEWRPISWRRGTKGRLAARFAAMRVRIADGPTQRIHYLGAQHLPGEIVKLAPSLLSPVGDRPDKSIVPPPPLPSSITSSIDGVGEMTLIPLKRNRSSPLPPRRLSAPKMPSITSSPSPPVMTSSP